MIRRDGLEENIWVASEERIQISFDLRRLFLRPQKHEVLLVGLDIHHREVKRHMLVRERCPEEVVCLHRLHLDDLVSRIENDPCRVTFF